MTKNIVNKIDDFVKVKTILVSVSDKTGLSTFISGIVEVNPDIRILSTGGTYTKIQEILGQDASKVLTQVSDYTGQPETQGGLVKTLDFKIYLGLLTEKYNNDHQNDLQRTKALPIDMVVVNLYPFADTVSQENCTQELARGNIDIGGPTMIRAASKNFIRVASVVDPDSYPLIIEKMKSQEGALCLQDRFELSRKAFSHTAKYDNAIAEYLSKLTYKDVQVCYKCQDSTENGTL